MRSTLLLLLLVATPAQAQSLKLPTAVFASAAATDWASTYVGVTRHHQLEQNPLINQLQSRPVEMVVTGAAIDAAGVVAWQHLMRHHTRIGAVGLYVGAAARLYLATRNVSRSRRPSFWSGGSVGIK